MPVLLNGGRIATENQSAFQGTEAHFATFFSELLGITQKSATDNDHWRELVATLCRSEEWSDRRRFDDCCWEPCFSASPASYQVPRVESQIGLSAGQLKWPNGKRFAVCLTHDIDHLQAAQFCERYRALIWGAGKTWSGRRRLLASALRHGIRRIAGPGHYPMDIWTRLEERFGFRSTFFFMAAPPAQPHSRDGLYVLEDRVSYEGKLRPLKEILPDLAARGWEVGLHGSIATAFNADLARRERIRLSEAAKVEVISGRQHWLTYDIGITPRIHQAAGILADSTLGSNLLPICFRAGTGLPFPMYDLEADEPLNVVQVPLVVHDIPLLQANTKEHAVATAIQCLTEAASRGSLVTLLFHNDHHEDSLAFQVYQEVLSAAHDLGAWGCTVKEVYTWLQSRSAFGRPSPVRS